MQSKIYLFLSFFMFSMLASAQSDTTYWTKGGYVSATFSNVSLSDHWAAGGAENISVNAAMGLFADFKKDRATWENSLDLGYGVINQDNAGYEKSDDRIMLVSKFGYKIQKDNDEWYYSGLIDFKTQFAQGVIAREGLADSVISNFMVPGYLTVGLGVDYKPSDKLSFNYIPLTGKFTFVNDQGLADAGAYGVDPGKKFRAEMGSFLRVKYKDEIVKNVSLDTRLELFTNYVENFGAIDVNWQNTIVMKINSVLSANLFTHLIYDEDIKTLNDDDTVGDAKVQWKSVFGVGLAYNFGAKK